VDRTNETISIGILVQSFAIL